MEDLDKDGALSPPSLLSSGNADELDSGGQAFITAGGCQGFRFFQGSNFPLLGCYFPLLSKYMDPIKAVGVERRGQMFLKQKAIESQPPVTL